MTSRLSFIGATLAVVVLSSSALANPKVIEILVPEPTPPPPAPSPPVSGDLTGSTPAEAAPNAATEGGTPPIARPIVRRGPREVLGSPPAFLQGRYEVVQVTRGQETEDFHIKMDREGRALEQDCITDRYLFDFGTGDLGAALPSQISVALQQRCTKGGLGSYANELSIDVPATWRVEPDGRLVMALPPVEATAMLVRVRPPLESDDINTPSHWVGPVTRIEQRRIEFSVVAEAAKAPTGRRPKPTDPPVVLPPAVVHLVGKELTYHLEPEPALGLFLDPIPDNLAKGDVPTPKVEPELLPLRPSQP